ncbi:unnamed protein product [Parajaminaea phylloscopi]
MCSAHVRAVRKSNTRRRRTLLQRLGLEADRRSKVVGFFHPYCNAGGGGERVLFEAMRHHLSVDPDIVCVVYTGDVSASHSLYHSKGSSTGSAKFLPGSSSIADGGGTATTEEILTKAKQRFDIDLSPYASRIAFLPLKSRGLVADKYWKRLTMLGQSLGGAVLAKEACEQLIPDVFIDTMGYAFALPVVRVFRHDCPIGAYVHYPTISTDMLKRVQSRQAGHTNDSAVAASALRSHAKVIYYRIFAAMYTWALRRADVVVANGSWTRNHLVHLLNGREAALAAQALDEDGDSQKSERKGRRVEVVYPPCDTTSFSVFPLAGRDRHTFVSLAQFRPEKEHATQLRFLRAFLDRRPDLVSPEVQQPVRLIMIGSSRNPGDEERIRQLRELSLELKLDAHVEFVVNAPYSVVLEHLSKADVGLSTMVDEHFGINVVEFMAAGLITLSHASAGPLLDIAVPVKMADGSFAPTGYHATDVQAFAEQADSIASLTEQDVMGIRKRARERAQNTFSTAAFTSTWDEHLWQPLEARLRQRDRKPHPRGSPSDSSRASLRKID